MLHVMLSLTKTCTHLILAILTLKQSDHKRVCLFQPLLLQLAFGADQHILTAVHTQCVSEWDCVVVVSTCACRWAKTTLYVYTCLSMFDMHTPSWHGEALAMCTVVHGDHSNLAHPWNHLAPFSLRVYMHNQLDVRCPDFKGCNVHKQVVWNNKCVSFYWGVLISGCSE